MFNYADTIGKKQTRNVTSSSTRRVLWAVNTQCTVCDSMQQIRRAMQLFSLAAFNAHPLSRVLFTHTSPTNVLTFPLKLLLFRLSPLFASCFHGNTRSRVTTLTSDISYCRAAIAIQQTFNKLYHVHTARDLMRHACRRETSFRIEQCRF